MPKPNTVEICRLHLFDDISKIENELSQQMLNRLLRIRSAYTIWNQYPFKKEKEIRDLLISQYAIDRSTAYEDIQVIKQLLGDFNAASKAWHRFKFNAMIEKAYSLAEKKQNPVAMSMAADKYGKYNQLDKEDAEQLPWSEIVVQPFEITSDPSTIGIKPVPNIKEKIAKLKEKYFADIQDINYEDVTIEDIFTQTPTNLPPNE